MGMVGRREGRGEGGRGGGGKGVTTYAAADDHCAEHGG